MGSFALTRRWRSAGAGCRPGTVGALAVAAAGWTGILLAAAIAALLLAGAVALAGPGHARPHPIEDRP